MSQLIITCDEPPRPPLNGNNRKAFELIESVCSEHSVHLLAYPNSDADWKCLEEQWRLAGVVCHRLCRRTGGRHFRMVTRRLSIPTVTRDFQEEARLIRQLSKRDKTTRLVIDFISGAPLLEHIRGSGVILSGHDCMSYLFQEEGRWATNWRSRMRFRFRRLCALNAERRFAHLARWVHLVSENDVREFQRVNPAIQTRVIPIGGAEASPNDLRPFAERGRKLIWGSLRSELIVTGMRRLLRAVLSMSGSLSGWSMVGRVPRSEAYNLLPEMLALNIQYEESIPEILKWLGEAKVLVLPDIGGTGQKNRTLDGMSHGACVMGLSEVFRGVPRGTGRTSLEFSTHEALAAAMLKVDQLARPEIGAAALEVFRSHFSRAALRREWLQLIGDAGDLTPGGTLLS